jgi:L-2-hydroxyglutarate oxidase LhgO
VTATDTIDVAVIGGGVVGCAVARALAAPGREVMLFETGGVLGAGITSRNSGVIHSGLYYAPGSLKAASCVRGNALLYEWARRREVWHSRCGKLVVATSREQLPALEQLYETARANEATGLTMLTAGRAMALEPNIPIVAALHCADTGIVDPHELVLSLRAEAEARGATILTGAAVTALVSAPGGYLVTSTRGEVLATTVVNAAGMASDQLARMVGLDRHTIYPCRGDYFRLRTPTVYRQLIYPVKDPANPGLGIHLTLERGGGYRLGPDAEYVSARDDFREAEHKHPSFLAAARRLLGPVDAEQISYDGCGIRPKLRSPEDREEKDFVLEEQPAGCIHLIGIESPGLTAALDLAERVAARLR